MKSTRDWKTIPADPYDWTITRKPERPWIHDYSRTMTMKMYLAEPDGKGGSRVFITVEKAAEIMRQADALTLGAPKIVYLVGWQYNGHDDRYPAWHKGNPHIRRPPDREALDSIRWLMDQGRSWHTTVSVHINMYDAYENSPLWQTYLENGLITTTREGEPDKAGVWNGLQAYAVNYKREWETGFAKKRIDELLELLPLERAGTVHIDAFHCRPDHGRAHTLADSQGGRRQIFRYWRDRGIDVTSEFLYDEADGWEKPGEDQLIGLQPMAWHFSQLPWDYVDRPASLICGGDAGHRGKVGGERLGDLFGENITAEPLWTDFGTRRAREDWAPLFLDDFCLKYLPFRFLNGLERQSFACAKGELTAAFSESVVTSSRGPSLRQEGSLLRDAGDVFLPADWVSPSTFVAYSRGGGTRSWTLPRRLRAATGASLRQLTTGGTGPRMQADVGNGTISVRCAPGQAFVVDVR